MIANIVLLFIMPYTAPSIWLLIATRTMISLFNTILETSPLVVDYIKKDSRGTAVALGTIGALTGEAFGMAVLLGFTIGMTIEDAHAFSAVILLSMTIIGSFGLREPRIRGHEKIEEEAPEGLTCWQKTKFLTQSVKQEVVKDMKYLFCFVAVMVTKLIQVLYSVYLVLWITNFV